MDPAKYGPSRTPLHHNVYPLISPEALKGAHAGKTAVVTGAARGIGRAIAIALAQSGANLSIIDLKVDTLADTAASCAKFGVKVKPYSCDVTQLHDCKKVFSQIEQDLGPVDILVNNAGKSQPRPISMQKFEDFWSLVEVNLKGPLIWAWQVLPGMRTRKSGIIINVASRASTVDLPFGVGYSCGKTGLVRAVAGLQGELEIDGLGEAVQTYSLHPGGVKSTMGGSPTDPDVVAKYPRFDRSRPAFQALFKDEPELCAQTCAYLATGRAKDLRGLYIDCRQDLGILLEIGRETLVKNDLYSLKVGFLDEYSNEP